MKKVLSIIVSLMLIVSPVYALDSEGVIYDNSTSGSNATNVESALNDLYSKLNEKQTEINTIKNIGNATATAADIKSGKTAYVNGSKITGTSSSLSVGDVMTAVRGSGKSKAELVVPSGVTDGFVIVTVVSPKSTNLSSKISGSGVVTQEVTNMGTFNRGDENAYVNTRIYKVELTPGGTVTANALNYYSQTSTFVGTSIILLA